MAIGVVLPNSGPLPLRTGVDVMAHAAEQAGANSLWVSDHLVMVDAAAHDYPYSSDGRPTWDVTDDYLEALTTCAYIAAATTTCLIGTAALVLPQRNVLQVAKEVATIDRLSGGRFVLGASAGWNEAEMAALGYDFQRRGRRLDEMLTVLRDCWSGHPGPHHGATVSIPDRVVLYPRPAKPDGPPILIGGMTPPALRRAARLGDGWLALAFVEDFDEGGLSRGLARFREQRQLLSDNAGLAVLKLHCGPENAAGLKKCALRALEAGYDQVVIEPPWPHGIEAAAEVIDDVVSAADR